jgi:putative ABC transport system substrate-binding protein
MNRIAAAAVALLVLIGALLPASAQQPGKVYHVGFLWESPSVLPDALGAFRRGLRDLGWVEGKSFVLDYRWSEGRYDHLNELAQELVSLKVNLIVAPSSYMRRRLGPTTR